jgi:hypothetical protein
MHRILASLDEFEDAIQASLSAGNRESGRWFQAKFRQPNNVRDIEILKPPVIGNVEEVAIVLTLRTDN